MLHISTQLLLQYTAPANCINKAPEIPLTVQSLCYYFGVNTSANSDILWYLKLDPTFWPCVTTNMISSVI